MHGAKHREHPRRMELRCQKHSDDQRKVRAHVGERAGEFVAVNRTCGQSCGCRASIVLVCAMCQRRLKARLDQLHETRTARYMRLYTFCLWLDVQLSRLYLVKSVVRRAHKGPGLDMAETHLAPHPLVLCKFVGMHKANDR